MTIKIDPGVPLTTSGTRRRYPFRDMAVGDSFFVPGMTCRDMRGALSRAKRETGWRFATRRVDNGLRIWKIE